MENEAAGTAPPSAQTRYCGALFCLDVMDDQTIINSRGTSGRFLPNRTHLTPGSPTQRNLRPLGRFLTEISPEESFGLGCWRYRGLPLLGGQRVLGPPAAAPRAAEEEGRGQEEEGGGGQQDEPQASERTDHLHTRHRSKVTHFNEVHVCIFITPVNPCDLVPGKDRASITWSPSPCYWF